MTRQKIVRIGLSASVIGISLILLQRLLVPKYVTDVVEGRMIAEYYEESDKDHDVIFIGDCEVYENFSPQVLWDDYGINSYIRGSAQQLVWQSYYLLEDTLRYEQPDVVVFNVLAMKYNTPQNEAYNRMSLEGMRWSWSKVLSIEASMTEEENLIEYVFPLLRYHSRWQELGKDDITYMFRTKQVSFNGYYMRTDIKPAENVPEGKKLADYTFGDNAYLYLDKMVQLCKDNGIRLVLIKAPSLYPYWYDEWDEQMEQYAAQNGLLYVNLLEAADEIGLDYSRDTYDGGLHLNLYGAEKTTRYLGRILQQEYGLADRHQDAGLEAEWQAKTAAYEAEIQRQGGYKEP